MLHADGVDCIVGVGSMPFLNSIATDVFAGKYVAQGLEAWRQGAGAKDQDWHLSVYWSDAIR